MHTYLKLWINAATNLRPCILFRIFHFLKSLKSLLCLSVTGQFSAPHLWDNDLGKQLWEREALYKMLINEWPNVQIAHRFWKSKGCPCLWERKSQVCPILGEGGNSGAAQKGGHVQLYRYASYIWWPLTLSGLWRSGPKWRIKWVIIHKAFGAEPEIWWSPINVKFSSYSCELFFLRFVGKISSSKTT